MGFSPSKVAQSFQPPQTKPSQPKKSRFLALPAELRVKVYKEVLGPTLFVPRRQSPGGELPNVTIKEPAIMAVCRLLHQEAQPIFYDGLRLVIDRNNLFESSRDSMRSLDLISEAQIQQIRHIEIPWAGKVTIGIHFARASKQHEIPTALHSATAQGAGFHVRVTSSDSDCTNAVCTSIAVLVRDFLLSLIVHRARIRICGSLGSFRCRPRATQMKQSKTIEEKIKGEKLEFLKRGEVEWLLSHLKFDGKHFLREAGLLSL